MHVDIFTLSFAFASAGRIRVARMEIIAITTNNSSNVKPRLPVVKVPCPGQSLFIAVSGCFSVVARCLGLLLVVSSGDANVEHPYCAILCTPSEERRSGGIFM
jgi:hypothetical protein